MFDLSLRYRPISSEFFKSEQTLGNQNNPPFRRHNYARRRHALEGYSFHRAKIERYLKMANF